LSASWQQIRDPAGHSLGVRSSGHNVTEPKRAQNVQEFLARTSSGTAGEPFFNALARYLAQSLGMDFVCIDRLEGDGLTAQTVAVWCDGHFEDNVSYALKDTPCGQVVGKAVCCYPASVCQYFPRDQVLEDLRAESYIGATLWSHEGKPIGLIAVISRSPLANRSQAEATLKWVAERAARELERLQYEQALLEAEWKFRALFENGPIGVAYHAMIYDSAGTPSDYLFLDANASYRELTGVDPRGKTATQAFPGIENDSFDWIGTYGRVARTGEPIRFEQQLESNGRWYDCCAYQYKPDHFVVAFLEITKRKRAEASLQESLREKESLLKEIHHRVKNNLQIISSLLRLQAGRLDSPSAKAALQDMQNRVRSMALIHETLYRSENLAAVDLADYLKSLCQQLFRTLVVTPGSPQLHLDLAPVCLQIDQAIPCGLLVNELVSNALKHAFPAGRRGELRIELATLAEGAGWRLRVADDGVGLPPGFDLQDLTSLGLKLVSDLARQLGARLEIGAGPGAVFEIEFKASLP
jgi:two-component sensor histidine kinase